VLTLTLTSEAIAHCNAEEFRVSYDQCEIESKTVSPMWVVRSNNAPMCKNRRANAVQLHRHELPCATYVYDFVPSRVCATCLR
jgi:hypothetical protein